MYKLENILSLYRHKQVFTGWSGAEVYYLSDLAAYLKIAPVESLSNLRREKEVLEWLEGKLAVPKVLGFEENGIKHSILLSEIKGVPGSVYVAAGGYDTSLLLDFVRAAARAMRGIHDLPIADCPLLLDLDTKLSTAMENIKQGFVDESDFDRENQGRSAKDVYDELIEKKPLNEDLVFTHGDLCLPNIMIIDGEISGFIDFDRGGIADRYQDIALFLRSFAHNIEIPIDVRETFCTAYGIDSLDDAKLFYYRLLDELF
jgi:aminoglycoside phosphotransferase